MIGLHRTIPSAVKLKNVKKQFFLVNLNGCYVIQAQKYYNICNGKKNLSFVEFMVEVGENLHQLPYGVAEVYAAGGDADVGSLDGKAAAAPHAAALPAVDPEAVVAPAEARSAYSLSNNAKANKRTVGLGTGFHFPVVNSPAGKKKHAKRRCSHCSVNNQRSKTRDRCKS